MKKKRIYWIWRRIFPCLLSTVYFLLSTACLAQITFERTYGGSGQDWGLALNQTSDGGFIIAGRTRSFGAGGYDVYLVKTDGNGLVWVEEKDNYQLPVTNFQLFQNQPNPLNESSVIGFQLSAPAHITLKIYDVSGRLVGTLLDKKQEPGVYQLPISNYQLQGSGIYFYRLTAGAIPTKSETRQRRHELPLQRPYTATKKMILLR